jgi:hypothetical protein
MRLSNARTSSSWNALPIESIGVRWRISANCGSGAAPTRWVGESGVRSSGCCASSSCSSRNSASYSASLISGASST